MVLGQRSGQEDEDRFRNPNPATRLPSPKLKIRKDEHRPKNLVRLPGCSEELEALLRKVVREELNQALCLHSTLRRRSSLHEFEPPVSRNLQLCFVYKFPKRIFTGNKIEAEGLEGPRPLEVVLRDANTGAVVSQGPLSSMRIECVVLHGDFKVEERSNWTEKEFRDNVLCEREGRKPLLTGERVIRMTDGVAIIKNVSISDNSSWVRSKRFRFGVRVVQNQNLDDGVQEAVSSAFEVKDRRGEPYQKHGTPSLEDEVWRLCRIGKDGPHSRRLAENGIRTVKDFLQRYYVDASSLLRILGVSNRVWGVIAGHAKSCLLNDDQFCYFSAEEGVGLLLNCVLNILGVSFDGQNYQSLETLTKTQKLQVDRLRRYAYENQSVLIPTDVPGTASVTLSPCDITLSTSSSLTDLHYLDGPDQTQEDMNLDQIFSVESNMSDEPLFRGLYDAEPTWVSTVAAQPCWSMLDDTNMFHVQTTAWLPVTPTISGAGTGLFMTSTSDSNNGAFSPVWRRKPRVGWSKVRAALTMGELPGCCY